MREGRMKGQAFVTLPSDEKAKKALRETNGYVLYDKPIVTVSFIAFGCHMSGIYQITLGPNFCYLPTDQRV